PLSSVDYFQSVVTRLGQRDTDSFLRLYMAPGVQHCSSGPGPDAFGQDTPVEGGAFSALIKWVETGVAPTNLIAAKANGSVKRPLCPYPQRAQYKGSGDPNDAGNFACAAAK